MIIARTIQFVTCLSILNVSALTAAEGSSQGTALPPQLAQVLSDNAAQLNPIDINLTTGMRCVLTAEEAEKLLGTSAEEYSNSRDERDQRVIWQDGLIYLWERMPEMRRTREISSDGHVFYSGSIVRPAGAEVQPLLKKEPLQTLRERQKQQSRADVNQFDAAYFEIAGIDLSTTVEDLLARRTPQSIILKLLEEGAQVKAVELARGNESPLTRIVIVGKNQQKKLAESEDLVKLERGLRKRFKIEQIIQARLKLVKQIRELPDKWVYTFRLDPQLKHALRDSEIRYEDGTLLVRATCDDFQPVNDRVVLPRKCQRETFMSLAAPNVVLPRPITIETFSVSTIRLTPVPESQFVLNYTIPGTTIIDRTVQPEQTFKVPVSLSELDRAVNKATSISKSIDHSGRWLIILINLAFVAFVLILITVRRRRSRAFAHRSSSKT